MTISCRTVVDGLQGFLFQVDISEIVVHEGGEQNAVANFFDTEFSTGEIQKARQRLALLTVDLPKVREAGFGGCGVSQFTPLCRQSGDWPTYMRRHQATLLASNRHPF